MTDEHVRFMERALLLAERGRGRTTPNPIVGAVVVSRQGIVLGQGAHLIAGGPHAEVMALREAGSAAVGSTLYCTLEPCSHVGRTGPCVERIVEAGVDTVVAAETDPNPIVAGRGFAYLRSHGVHIVESVCREDAALQHAPFSTWITRRRPFVIAKVAVSADGFVGRTDAPVRLTSPDADRYFHRQRAEIDAIAVGAGTVLVDDPRLTAREAYRFRPLTRVVVDWRGRVPVSARLFTTLESGPVIMVVLATAVAERRAHFDRLAARGVTLDVHERRDLSKLLERLAAHDVVSLLVEGGPGLHRALWEARLVDRVQIVSTPVRLGDGVANGLPSIARPGRSRRLGPDLLMETDVHGTD